MRLPAFFTVKNGDYKMNFLTLRKQSTTHVSGLDAKPYYPHSILHASARHGLQEIAEAHAIPTEMIEEWLAGGEGASYRDALRKFIVWANLKMMEAN